MSPHRLSSERGAIILVALCFAAVIGISLASYLAVSSQAMRLSNRSFQADLSRQLAEAGIEHALAAMNANDWSGWTISGTTATRTVTFPSTKYGSLGVTGSFKLRVDNYTAYESDSTWTTGVTYNIGDVVGRNGSWYTCIRSHSSQQPPNRIYWIESGVGWQWNSSTTYRSEDLVNRNGYWFRAINGPHSQAAPTNGTSTGFWTHIPYMSADSALYYTNESILNYYGTWYRYNSGWSNTPPILWRWRSGKGYVAEDLVCYSNVWYRCIRAHTSSGSILPTNPTYWSAVTSFWTWNSSHAYSRGDVVHRSGSWYRAVRANSNQQPPNANYWSNAPAGTPEWVPGRTYPASSVVRHNGIWYYTSVNTTNTPGVGTWQAATTTTWNSTANYAANAHVSYSGVWYRSTAANSGRTPNDSSFWTAVSAPVVYSEGVATLPDGATISTQLRANVGPAALFPNAVAATGGVNLGTTTTIDSYDAATGTYASQLGTAANFSAVVAGGDTGNTAVALSSATVKGYVAAPPNDASPFDPLVSYATTAILRNQDGSVSTPSASASNVDLARISRSPYIPQLEIQTVAGGTELSSLSDLTLGTPGDPVPAVYYSSSSMDLNSAAENITINGPVVLSITGQLRIRSNPAARIRITPTGSLRLVVSRDFRLESSGGGIVNETLDPKNLVVLLSRSGNDTFHLSCTAQPFYGAVYLPNSSSTFTIADGVEMYGAISAQNLTFSGSASLHYDIQLRHKAIPGVEQAFIITDWRELTQAERASL